MRRRPKILVPEPNASEFPLAPHESVLRVQGLIGLVAALLPKYLSSSSGRLSILGLVWGCPSISLLVVVSGSVWMVTVF